MKKEIKFEKVRFHQPAFVLGKTLSGFTPQSEPGIRLRETASGNFEFFKKDRLTNVVRVAWVPASTIESIEYVEEPNEAVRETSNGPSDIA